MITSPTRVQKTPRQFFFPAKFNSNGFFSIFLRSKFRSRFKRGNKVLSRVPNNLVWHFSSQFPVVVENFIASMPRLHEENIFRLFRSKFGVWVYEFLYGERRRQKWGNNRMRNVRYHRHSRLPRNYCRHYKTITQSGVERTNETRIIFAETRVPCAIQRPALKVYVVAVCSQSSKPHWPASELNRFQMRRYKKHVINDLRTPIDVYVFL